MLASLLALTLSLTATAIDHTPHHHHMASDARSVVAADVRTVDVDARRALLRHEAMPELAMPSMVMEFALADDVDISLFEPGAALQVTVTQDEDGLVVIAAEPEPEL